MFISAVKLLILTLELWILPSSGHSKKCSYWCFHVGFIFHPQRLQLQTTQEVVIFVDEFELWVLIYFYVCFLQSAAAAPSPVLGNLPPGEGMPVGPVPPGFFQPFMSPRYPGGPRPPLRLPNQGLGGVPGSQPMLPSGMDPTRQQGHPNMGGPMQRMTPPRGMVPLGPQNYGGGMRPPLNALVGPGMPGMNMGPGGGRPWPNPPNSNSTPYSSASPGSYVGPPGGGGPPGTPIMPSPADSTNSGDNMYTMINTVPPGGSRPNFPMGAGGDGPLGGMAGMEPHHMNGSLGSGDMDSLPKNSPGNLSMSNQPGTPGRTERWEETSLTLFRMKVILQT
ncbi:hypothetical protein INR49_006125 [Caranx melampygus]|nr:hypothetical protein INR49_006125 [Caranx melampygus]